MSADGTQSRRLIAGVDSAGGLAYSPAATGQEPHRWPQRVHGRPRRPHPPLAGSARGRALATSVTRSDGSILFRAEIEALLLGRAHGRQMCGPRRVKWVARRVS
jgi:hypothetical protein